MGHNSKKYFTELFPLKIDLEKKTMQFVSLHVQDKQMNETWGRHLALCIG